MTICYDISKVIRIHKLIYSIVMCIRPILREVAETFQPAKVYISLAVLSLLILPLSHSLRGEMHPGLDE